ncbi:MAG: radical SAM protein, partial [Verrucomicrobia bacterium]|nr:radical SAM protein [Cytophagales bacterium]
MAGLYIHIPFCRKACHYCDFHFSTNLSLKTDMVNAIVKEIALQKDYLPAKSLQSIYFGGGTPSLLTESELGQIFEAIYKFFTLEKDAEITLEANPDDLTKEKIKSFKNLKINRLSIGIQSFDENHLKLMNRLHTATEAENSVRFS